MRSEWKFLDEIHDFTKLPKDNIPEIIFGEGPMLENHH